MAGEDDNIHLPLSRTVLQGSSIGTPVVELDIEDDGTWTKILDAPYTVAGKKVNGVNIQLQSGGPIKINYADMGVGNWEGMLIPAGVNERQYMIRPNAQLVLYVKPEPGSGTAHIAIEKLAGA